MQSLTIGQPQRSEDQYQRRTAVRCLMTSGSASTSQICIIYVEKGNYFKLPGGGVESDDENHVVAVKREALEETGCEVDVNSALVAKTTEWRGDLMQESYAYACSVAQDTGKVTLTDQEASEGLKHEWCSLPDALTKVQTAEPTSELGRYIKERDTFLLRCYIASKHDAEPHA